METLKWIFYSCLKENDKERREKSLWVQYAISIEIASKVFAPSLFSNGFDELHTNMMMLRYTGNLCCIRCATELYSINIP